MPSGLAIFCLEILLKFRFIKSLKIGVLEPTINDEIFASSKSV